MHYSPSSTLSAEGAVAVSSFSYSASTSGAIQPNQIRNTAMGTILFDKDIAKVFEEAVFTEFRFVGIKVASEKLEITGDIQEFLIDDLGFSVDWTLRVKYQIKNKQSGEIAYTEVKELKKTTEKFGNIFGALNEVIKLNIESLIRDEKFKALIK